MLEASKVVDVISPNHHEFAAYFQGGQLADPDLSELATLASRCNEVLANGFQEKLGAVVVRRGEKGCYVASHERHTSFPAYHQPPRNVSLTESPDWKTKVMDPTGGGNGFLGGFCIGVLDDCCAGLTSHEYGALLGNVAASFAIEQVGMPKLTSTENGTELWNGAHVYDRVRHLREQMPVSLQPVNIDD
ncbi:hypothetical protein MMC19_004662 [Ptychographa xylographoides]|nr:hypothetical protein [Ptychographa xylographoides]